MAGCCEHDDETLGSKTKGDGGGNFLISIAIVSLFLETDDYYSVRKIRPLCSNSIS
jgi:hypothetical protein